MNKVVLTGRLTKDPELRKTKSDISVCSFTIAVDRRFKKEGEQQADFINCVAWRGTADFIAKYLQKGRRIEIAGSIQTRTWDDNGTKRYATEILVDEAGFGGDKPQNSDSGGFPADDGFAPVDAPDNLPF